MHRSLSLFGVFGLACLSLFTFTTSAEAFGRCRNRQQCGAICAPVSYCQPSCGCQGELLEVCPQSQTLCMDCINGTWQQPPPGEPCTPMPASYEGHSCIQKPAMAEGVTGTVRVYRGCGLWFNWMTGSWTWYSNEFSTAYCDVSHPWYCSRRILATPKGTCENCLIYYDIYLVK